MPFVDDEIAAKLGRLSAEGRQKVLEYIDHLLAQENESKIRQKEKKQETYTVFTYEEFWLKINKKAKG